MKGAPEASARRLGWASEDLDHFIHPGVEDMRRATQKPTHRTWTAIGRVPAYASVCCWIGRCERQVQGNAIGTPKARRRPVADTRGSRFEAGKLPLHRIKRRALRHPASPQGIASPGAGTRATGARRGAAQYSTVRDLTGPMARIRPRSPPRAAACACHAARPGPSAPARCAR